MSYLDDGMVGRLQDAADLPDLAGSKYKLLRRLARGGMGTVYVVEDEELGRELALKVLSDPDPAGELSARLLAEARHLARLEHPNIVPIHDVGRLPDGRVFYVMKLVRGKRLDEWRNEQPSRAAVLRMFCRICEAAAFAHAQGVVHRDLKPENVMVGEFGEALVMDWGVAKLLASAEEPPRSAAARTPHPAPRTTASGSVVGTPAYMAPEQARGQAERIDARTDVYALGAMLWTLLAGKPPGASATGNEGQASWLPPPPLRQQAGDCPRALAAVCTRAMAENPAERYASAAELARDVERYLDGEAPHAYREGLLERGGRLLRRNRVLAYLILAYLAMRLVLLLIFGR